jgi:aspartyl-tRNA(Asn)/glutamyl-tRNA(Gln) amidotransferase subunit A
VKTLNELRADLASGRTTSRGLVEECLERIADPSGEGSRTFIKVHAEQARAAADYHDHLRKAGASVSPFAGIPISIKDLFDLPGDVTTAGSVVLADDPPATRDAESVGRLRAAGLIPIGRTNMTEFAYSGLGINPHYGTPRNPFDRATGRVPGGSSSGAAVSISDGMAFGALGTDTGGSCRIPAALCGIVGFKPTATRVSRAGAVPLSTSLDSVGPLASSVACCAVLDGVLAGETTLEVRPATIDGLRLGVPQAYVLDGLDADVAGAFASALGRLSRGGARIIELPLRELSELPTINAKGGITGAEAYAWHRDRIERHGNRYDARVASRIVRGGRQDAADYIELLAARANLIARVTSITAAFDALVMPTTPIVAPAIAALDDEDAYFRANGLVLRNPAVANFLDRCACSVPCHAPGMAPVGLMLMGETGADRRLLALAAAVEECLKQRG